MQPVFKLCLAGMLSLSSLLANVNSSASTYLEYVNTLRAIDEQNLSAKEAVVLMRPLADRGHIDAMVMAADYMIADDSTSKDEKKMGYGMLMKAIAAGSSYAKMAAYRLHSPFADAPERLRDYYSTIFNENDDVLIGWLTDAAADGRNADANYCLGMHYLTGLWVVRDYAHALIHLNRAASLGHSKAKLMAALLFFADENNIILTKQEKEARIYWLVDAAEGGNSTAQAFLGSMYLYPELARGIGLKKDVKAALFWFKESAKKGNKIGMSFLALYYAERHPSDNGDCYRAVVWSEKAKNGVCAELPSEIYENFASAGMFSTEKRCMNARSDFFLAEMAVQKPHVFKEQKHKEIVKKMSLYVDEVGGISGWPSSKSFTKPSPVR